jgi:hypothetical protein
MKLSLFILLASSLTCLAQPDSKWNFGFHAGVNSSLISDRRSDYYLGGPPALTIKSGFSFAGGLNAEYLISKRFAVSTGVQFQTAKSEWIYQLLSPNSVVMESRANFVNQYISTPAVVTYSLVSKNRFNFSVGIGSTFQFRLSSRVSLATIIYDLNHDPTSVFSGPSISLQEESNLILTSPTVQIAADLKLKHLQKLRFLASYSFSLNDPLSSGDAPPEVVYNYQIQFMSNKLQTISATIQYYWRGLHPNKN